jgi:hypothetical protein
MTGELPRFVDILNLEGTLVFCVFVGLLFFRREVKNEHLKEKSVVVSYTPTHTTDHLARMG